MKVVKRVILVLIALLMAAFSVFWLTVCWSIVASNTIGNIIAALQGSWLSVTLGTLAGLLLFGASVLLLFGEFATVKPEETYLIATSDHGDIRMTGTCLRQMCDAFSAGIPGVKEVRSNLKMGEAGLEIYLRLGVTLDMPIPTVTRRLQEALRFYLMETAGTSVALISVLVDKTFPANIKAASVSSQTALNTPQESKGAE